MQQVLPSMNKKNRIKNYLAFFICLIKIQKKPLILNFCFHYERESLMNLEEFVISADRS